jgi:hypothetical protein
MQVHGINLKYHFCDFWGWMQNGQYVFRPEFLAHTAKVSVLLLSIIVITVFGYTCGQPSFFLSLAPKCNCHAYVLIENCVIFVYCGKQI